MPPSIQPKVKVKITDKAERQRRLEVVAKLAKNSYAIVGVKNPSRPYPGTDVTTGQVAAFMEFGTDTVPSRSFLRNPIDSMMGDIQGKAQSALRKIITSEMSIADALGSLGFFVSNGIVNTIEKGINPPLAMATRAAKREDRPLKGVSTTPDTPLMDTHQLIDSIGYEVYLGDAGGDV